MIGEIIGLADTILELVKTKIERKYIEAYNDAKRKLREEEAKPRAQQSDAVLDNLKFELRLAINSIATEARRQNSGN